MDAHQLLVKSKLLHYNNERTLLLSLEENLCHIEKEPAFGLIG